MSSDVLVPLREIADLRSGGTPSKSREDYWNGDIPWISGKTLHHTFVSDSDLRVTEEGLSAGSNLAPMHSSLILVRGMSLLQEIRIGMATRPVAFNQDVKAIVARPTVSPRYLNLALRAAAPALLDQVHQAGHGTGVLATDRLTDLPIWLPPLEEQERIAGVLGAFDDLIETNRRLATYLETLTKAVSSRPQGRVPLAQVADVPRLVQRRPEGLVDHYSIPAYDSGYLASRESGEAILSGKQMLVTDSVLISRLNPTTERTWMVYPDELVSAVCSPEFAVVRGTEALPSEVLWALASRPDFWDQMRGSVGGTTNSRQRVDKAAIPAFEVPDPNELSEPEVATIEMCVRSAVQLRREAAAVSSQRDELLPLLMSGRVRVRDVEAAVS